MEYNAYFDDIHEHIMDVLKKSSIEITMALAWFTDPEIYNLLCNKAAQGVTVRLLLQDDNINTGKHGLNFERLTELGGKIYFIPLSGQKSSIMHNKFVVLDRATVLTGSYNWTRRARKNSENITVITGDIGFSRQFLEEFENLLIRYGFGQSDSGLPVNPQLIARRLDVIKNFLLLDEVDEAVKQATVLSAYKGNAALDEILKDISAADIDSVIQKIDRFSIDSLAMIQYQDPEEATLKLELKTLEIELSVVSERRVDIERKIYQFSQVSNIALGSLLAEYLRLRREKLDKERITNIEKESEFEQADKDYREYQEALESEENKLVTELDRGDKKKLKDLYKRASRLCHPDKVVENDKKMAQSIFVELQKAYRENNLKDVESIFDNLKNGDMFMDIADAVSQKDAILKNVRQMRLKVEQMLDQITQLEASDTYQTLRKTPDIKQYIEEQKQVLTQQINQLQTELSQ